MARLRFWLVGMVVIVVVGVLWWQIGLRFKDERLRVNLPEVGDNLAISEEMFLGEQEMRNEFSDKVHVIELMPLKAADGRAEALVEEEEGEVRIGVIVDVEAGGGVLVARVLKGEEMVELGELQFKKGGYILGVTVKATKEELKEMEIVRKIDGKSEILFRGTIN